MVPSNSQANGGGLYINSYSMIFDINIPSTTNTWIPLLSSDGDSTQNQVPILSLRKNGAICITFENTPTNISRDSQRV